MSYFFSGKIQVDAAISVLEMSGLNPQATETLKSIRDAHDLTSSPGVKDDLTFYFQGGATGAIKADITVSALLAESKHALPSEARAAAAGLLKHTGCRNIVLYTKASH